MILNQLHPTVVLENLCSYNEFVCCCFELSGQSTYTMKTDIGPFSGGRGRGRGRGRGPPWNLWRGCAAQPAFPFSDQNMRFSFPISDLTLKNVLLFKPKIYTLFQTARQNISNLRPKCLKSIPIFRPKWLKKHTLWNSTCLYSLYRGVPPGLFYTRDT